jgi:hypothetical protein
MVKFGVTSVKQFLEGKDQTLLRRKKTVSIVLYDQLPDTPYADKLAERILVQFSDDRGAFKRTYSARFNDFDDKAVETIATIAPSDRDLVVHDAGVSDARTSVDFFERLERKFPRLVYYASDYDAELFVIEKGRVKIVVNRDNKILEISRPPFVFNMFARESMIAYPLNHLVRFALRRMVGSVGPIQLESGAKKIALFCRRAQDLAKSDPRFQLGRYNLLEAPHAPERSDLIRAMNVLNPDYFSPGEFPLVIRNLWTGLADSGILITGSNQNAGTQVRGGAYQKKDSKFIKLWDSCGGSPVEHYILGYTSRQEDADQPSSDSSKQDTRRSAVPSSI